MLKTLTLIGLLFAAGAYAQPTVSAVVDSIDYSPQLSPGMVASVYGANFGTDPSTVSVTVGGKTAYIIPKTLTASQVGIEIPLEVPAGATTLTVTVGGVASAPFNISLAQYAPDILTQNSMGSGLANVYTTPGNTLITPTAPAHPGDNLFLYAVGLGQSNPPSATGVIAQPEPLAATPTLTVGGVNATIVYAGIVSAGLYQVNFTVPTGVQGTQPLVLTISGVSSSSTIELALPGVTSLVSNATFGSSGIMSPGSIATMFANVIGTSTNDTAVFPATSSQGVSVTFNGEASPLFHVLGATNPQQIDLLVPNDLPTSGTVNVQLTTSTAFYANYPVTMVPANPGMFRVQDPAKTTRENIIAQFNGTAWLALPVSTTSALGLPACTTSTNKLSECGQPATIGDYLVLYGTGLGLTTPSGDPNGTPLATGAVPPIDGSVLYETPTTPVVTIGGAGAKVLYSGLVPGYVGEYEIVVQVPSGIASGDDVPVSVSILGATDSSTTISIQPRPS